MANQVTYENLFSESRNNVIALITSTNVPDPLSGSGEFRKWVYAREPDVKSADFKGYPFIVVHPADVDAEKDGGSLDGKSKFIYWDIEVEIVTSDRGYGANDGKGLSQIDTISNYLMKTFMNITNRRTLSTNSMKFANCQTSTVSTDVIDNELVFRRSIMIGFKSRIQVSA